ncbi:MAG: hypothetical protein ACYDEP_11130, partial [Acidimicrobiales bacterium]
MTSLVMYTRSRASWQLVERGTVRGMVCGLEGFEAEVLSGTGKITPVESRIIADILPTAKARGFPLHYTAADDSCLSSALGGAEPVSDITGAVD